MFNKDINDKSFERYCLLGNTNNKIQYTTISRHAFYCQPKLCLCNFQCHFSSSRLVCFIIVRHK